MTVHSYPRDKDEQNTYEELIEFWQRLDEPLTDHELHQLLHRRTPGIIVAARCFYASFVLITLVFLPFVLRAASQAVD